MNYRIYEHLRPEQATEPGNHPGYIVYPKALDREIYSKHYSVDGERIKTIYFAEKDGDSYSKPVVREIYEYNRDENGDLNYWELIISWSLTDGSWSTDTKTVRKYFNTVDKKRNERLKRRKNIINEVESAAVNFGLEVAIAILFDKYYLEIAKYRDAGSMAFRDAIQSDTELDFLNANTSIPGVTVRMWLISKFSIS